jgi:hypothetical protein
VNDNQFVSGDASKIAVILQSLSSTLHNIDLEHKRELERVASSALDGDFAALIVATLRARHRQRREPYVRHIAELRKQARHNALERMGKASQ